MKKQADQRQLALPIPGAAFHAASARAELVDHMPHQVKHRKRPGYTNPPQVGTRVDIVWRDQDGAEVLVPAVYLSSFPAEDGLLCVLALDLDACAQNRIFSPSLMAWLPRRFSGIRVGQLRKREK